MTKVNVYIDDRQKNIKLSAEDANLLLRLIDFVVADLIEEKEAELSLSFVDAEEIRRLNREYRGVDKNTDVLSFPMDEVFGGYRNLGDVIINTEKVREQAELYGHSYRREITYLTVHSLLHLVGYDHIEAEDKQIMREKEELLLGHFERKEHETR